jgi:hypothetical protein
MQSLAGAVAVVAWRDTRRRALGEAGATVYRTGRSVRANRSPYNRPERVEETAEMISAAGGSAVAVRVDHTMEPEVEALFQRVERERGRLDVLVNSIAGEDPLMARRCSFWKTDLKNAEAALRPRAYCGSDGKRRAQRQRKSGYPDGQARVSITPGFLRSETMLERFGVTEETWRDGGKKDKNSLESESPLFVGRAVVALAQDPSILERSGQLFSSWELGRAIYRCRWTTSGLGR